MPVTSDPIPPVPQHTPPLKEDEKSPSNEKQIGPTWNRWFISLRDKINVINESLVNLLSVSTSGFLVKNGILWVTRTLTTASSSRITIANGDGISGNPVFDLAMTGVTPGSYTNTDLTVDAYGRITAASNGSGGGGGGGGEILVADGFSAPPIMLTNEAEDDFVYSD